jgi:signal transduction histidine kinase
MRGYLETLTMPELAIDEPTRERYLGIIGDETARVERLIGDLMELARLEGGGGSLRNEPVSVGHLFARVAARHERACADAGVTLTTNIADGADTLIGDQDRLEQALQNLAANAIRYAPPGTAVNVTARPHGDRIMLSVEDAGPGISDTHLPHIFDRFYKADASRPFDRAGGHAFTGGSGLGLSIVKAIVERHGGAVTARSRPGQTVFEVELSRRPTSLPATNS